MAIEAATPQESDEVAALPRLVIQLVVLGLLVAVVANIASAWLTNQMWYWQLTVATLAAFIAVWAIASLMKRGLQSRTVLPCVVPFDRMSGSIVATTDLDDWQSKDWAAKSLVWNSGIMTANTAMKKLLADGLAHLPEGEHEGPDAMWSAILDSLQYALLEFMSRNYAFGWAIVDEASIHGMTSSSRGNAPATKISFEGLPSTLRENRVFTGIKPNEHGGWTGVHPTSFVLPKGMRVEHELLDDPLGRGEYRQLRLISRRTQIAIHLSPRSWSVMGNDEQQTRFGAYYPAILASVRTSFWHAFGRRASQERYWADDLVERIRMHFALDS